MRSSCILRSFLVILIVVLITGFPCTAYGHRYNDIDFFEIFEHNGAVVLLIDASSGDILHVNQSASRFYGYTIDQMESMNITDFTDFTIDRISTRMEEVIRRQISYFVIEHKLADGERRTVEVYACPHKSGDETLIFATIYDITETIALQRKNRLISGVLIATFLSAAIIAGISVIFLHRSQKKLKEQKKRIEYLSYHDSLTTGVYNRLFLEQELERLDIPDNLPISVIVGDVNGLKMTNDIFGHDAGDLLIKKAADAIKNACSSEDIIARTGGDEFIILLPKKGHREAEEIAGRVNHIFSEESILTIKASISMGWYTKCHESQSIHEVINIAEEKMYEAKVLDSEMAKSSTIKSIISTFYSSNPEEERHARSVSHLAEMAGKALQLSDVDVRKLIEAGYLHDIGKIVLSDELIKRYDDYANEQIRIIKKHVIAGYRILNSFDETLDLAGIVLAHHEYWDGSGYPRGLKGQEIPFLARIITAAEYYDEILNKPDINGNIELAVSMLKAQSGIKLDPQVVNVLCSIIKNENSNLAAAACQT